MIADYGLFDLFPNLCQILLHSFRILVLNDFEKIFQLRPDIGYLSRGAWVEQDFLKEVIACIEKNIDNSEYTIDSLSTDVVMSRMSLYRKMKSLTGQTPADFIRTVRLKTAAKLLKEEKCTVSEACYRTGFASPQNFAKHFKEMFGVLPSQYS